MQLNDQMFSFVMGLLKYNLPVEYFYHNHHHTEHIIEKVIEIGRYEKCTNDEIELLKLAALWHDTGYINTYEGHEEEGCKLVRKHFPDFGIPEKETEIVCDLIIATRIPQDPHNKLEQIIADADLEYLGTPNAARMAEKLFHELKFRNPGLSHESWNKTQIAFISSHHYFTNFCMQYREPLKQVYLQELKEYQAI
jgi:uncharacterized protein